MNKNMIARTFCNGLIFMTLLFTQNFALAQQGAGEKAAQAIESKVERLTSSHKEFHDAVKKVTEAANQAAKTSPNDADAVKKAARDTLDEEIKKAKGKPYQSELESLKKRWSEAEMINMSALGLEEQEIPRDKNGSSARTKRFSLSFGGLLPLGGITPQQVQYGQIEQTLYAPGNVERLFEKTGGPFSIGDLSGQPTKVFEMQGQTHTMSGFQFGFRLAKRFELRTGGHYFQTNWSGNFPVVAFSEQPGPTQTPKTIQGTLSASSSGLLAETDLAYFFTNGVFRPFVNAGVRAQFPLQHDSRAELAGVSMPLETTKMGTAFSPFGGAGVQVSFLKNGFVEAGTTFSKIPGGEYAPFIGLSVGWRFGGVQNPKEGPNLISINNDKCDCTSTIVELDAEATVRTRPRPNAPVIQNHTFKTSDTKSSVLTHGIKVAEGDKVSVKLENLVVNCQECKLGECPSIIKEVKIKVSGLAPFPKLDAKGKPEKGSDGKDKTTTEKVFEVVDKDGKSITSWEIKDIGVLAGTTPVRVEITVKYRCGKDKPVKGEECNQSPDCTNDFVVIFEREK